MNKFKKRCGVYANETHHNKTKTIGRDLDMIFNRCLYNVKIINVTIRAKKFFKLISTVSVTQILEIKSVTFQDYDKKPVSKTAMEMTVTEIFIQESYSFNLLLYTIYG